MKIKHGLSQLVVSAVVMFTVLAMTCLANAWTLTGSPISTTSAKTGRIYFTVVDNYGNAVAGASAPAGATSCSIRGVPSGSFTVNGYIDSQGTGFQHANDPVFTSGLINVSGDSTNPVAFSDPGAVAPVAPKQPNVVPLDGAAFVQFDPPKTNTNNNNVMIADSYNLYWSTSPDPGPARNSGGSQLLNISTKKPKILLTGLTNGSQLYFAVSAASSGGATALSAVTGPVTINAPAVTPGTSTVSVSVDTTGIAKNNTPLMIALSDDNDKLFLNYVKTSSDLATVAIPGVSAGTYKIYAILGLDATGNIDTPANISNMSDADRNQRAVPIMVDGVSAAVAGPTIKLAQRGAGVKVSTSHYRQTGSGDSFNLNFRIQQTNRQLVNVSLDSGPQITGPIDVPLNLNGGDGAGMFQLSPSLSGRPSVGDSYNLTLGYADGGFESKNAVVNGVLDTFPGVFFPVGTTGPDGVTPTFSWNTSANWPGFMSASINLNDFNAGLLPLSVLSVPYQGSNLSLGQTNYWNWNLQDFDGNQAQMNLSFTPSASGPRILSSPTTVAAGSSIVIGGSGFDPVAASTTDTIGGIPAIVTLASASSLTVTVPPGTSAAPVSSGVIVVTVGGVSAGSTLPFATTVNFTVSLTEGADGTTPTTSAKVSLVENPAVATTVNTGGVYVLPVPARPAFSMMFAQAGHYPTVSAIMNQTSDSNSSWSLFTAADLTTRGVNPSPGKGLIYAKVQDGTSNSSSPTVAGAVVTAFSLLHPDTPYTVKYTRADGTSVAVDPTATATGADGRYYVVNVDEGDYVTVTASKSGMVFQNRVFNTHGGMVFQGGIKGANVAVSATPPAGAISGPLAVTLTADPNDNIYYSTNGSDPTVGGTLYSAPVTVQIGTTLKFVAKNKNLGFAVGPVQSAFYSAAGVTGTASGTYTFDSASGALSVNWLTSTFCANQGPTLGPEAETVLSLTATTMIWADSSIGIWTRTPGIPGSILGTWSTATPSSGNTFLGTFNSNGTVTATGTIFNCGTGGTGNPLPSVPTGVSATPASPSQVSVSWTASSGTNGVANYNVYRNGVLVGQPSGQFNTNWSDSNVTLNATYSYTVAACDGSSNCSAQSSPAVQVTVAGQPGTASGIYSYAPGNNLLTLGWQASNFACNGPGLKTETKTVTALSATSMTWQDTSDATNTMSWSRASGTAGSILGTWTTTDPSSGSVFNLTFNADLTLSATGSVFCGGSNNNDTQAPSIPTGVTANAVSTNQVNLSWNASTDNVGVSYYQVYRNGTMVFQPSGPGSTFWSDTSLSANTGYNYQVAACDAANNCSAASTPPVQVTTPANNPPVFTTLNWGSVYHNKRNDGIEYDVLDIGVNSFAGTLAGAGVASLTVIGPNFSYTVVDADFNSYPTGQLSFFKTIPTTGPNAQPKLTAGVYTVTLTDVSGHQSHRMSTYVAPATALPQVDSSTIQLQRRADGSYRFSWAPVSDTKTYYYRLKVSSATNTPVFNSTRDMTSFADVPAGAMTDNLQYKARVEVFDAPNVDLVTNRTDSLYIPNFTPLATDYNPARVQVNYASAYSLATSSSTTVTQVGLGVDNPAAVTTLELLNPNGTVNYTFKLLTDITPDVTRYTGNLAGTAVTTDFFKQFTGALPPGNYKFHIVTAAGDQYAYATLSVPVIYPVVDSLKTQAEDLGNGNVRFSWPNVNITGAIEYRITVQDTVTKVSYMSARSNQAFVDVPKANLVDSNPLQWRVEVHDSTSVNTLRNRSNSAFIPYAPVAYDPTRPVITNFRVRNMRKNGTDFTHVGVAAAAAQATLASIVVTGPNGSLDLMSQGRFSTDFNSFFIEQPGSPASGLYTITVTGSTGKVATRYINQTAPHDVKPVDYHTLHVDPEPNGDVRLSWAPVTSDVPLWFQVHMFAQTDQNGDGLIDRIYSPYIMKDTNNDGILEKVTMLQQASLVIPAADLPTLVDPSMALIRTFDGSDTSVTNNYSQSVMVGTGSATVGFDYSTLVDADNDGFASNVDPNDSNPTVYPFSGGNASLTLAVSSTTPAPGSSNIATGTTVRAVFNKVIDPRTLAGNFTVSNGVGANGAFSFDPAARALTFIPSAPLSPATSYTVTLGTGVKDENGGALSPYQWSFSTPAGNQTGQTIGPVSFTPGSFNTGGTISVFASASSGLQVGFSSLTPTVCEIDANGTTVTAFATGFCTIAANQPGNATFTPAQQVTGSVSVLPPVSTALSTPSSFMVKPGSSVLYTVSYMNADSVNLTAATITINKTGTANGSVTGISGTTSTTRDVTISNITGEGTLGISVSAGTASGSAGTVLATASIPSAPFTVDATAPLLTISASVPANGATTGSSPLTVSGTVSDAHGIASLTVNGTPLTLSGNGFSTNLALVPGPNTITVIATDAAGNQATDTRSITYSQISQQCGAHHWTQLPGGTSPTIMHVAGNLTINGRAAGECDEIAAFDSTGNLIGYFYVQNAGQYGDMAINGDSAATPGLDEGAASGEKLTLRVWDGTALQEYATPSLLQLASTSSAPGYANYQAPLTFSAGSMVMLDVVVAPGVPRSLNAGWNMIGWTTSEGYYDIGITPLASEYITGARMSGVASKMISDTFGNMGLVSADGFVAVGPDGVVYTPGSPFNTLKKLLPGKGYWVYLPTAKSVTVPGDALAATDKMPLSQGWSQIGYWGTDGVTPATGFACINGQYDVLVDEAGKVFVSGSPFNTLKNMQKNKGYFIHTTAPTTLTFQCP